MTRHKLSSEQTEPCQTCKHGRAAHFAGNVECRMKHCKCHRFVSSKPRKTGLFG